MSDAVNPGRLTMLRGNMDGIGRAATAKNQASGGQAQGGGGGGGLQVDASRMGTDSQGKNQYFGPSGGQQLDESMVGDTMKSSKRDRTKGDPSKELIWNGRLVVKESPVAVVASPIEYWIDVCQRFGVAFIPFRLPLNLVLANYTN